MSAFAEFDRDLERTLVEREEKIAFLYVRAFLEVHLLDESADAGCSTRATASKRPEYSSQVLICFASGEATVTGNAGSAV